MANYHEKKVLRRVVINTPCRESPSLLRIDEEMNSDLKISQVSPIISLSQEYPQDSNECSPISPNYTTSPRLFQPSLAAGGVVDLSRTFTLTKHGTYSFGGNRKTSQTLPNTKIPTRTKSKTRYSNRDPPGNPVLNVLREDSAVRNQSSFLPVETNPTEVSQLNTLEPRIRVIDSGQISVPTLLGENIDRFRQTPSQVISIVPAVNPPHLSEVNIPRSQRHLQISPLQPILPSLGIQSESCQDIQSPTTLSGSVPRSIPSLLQIKIGEYAGTRN